MTDTTDPLITALTPITSRVRTDITATKSATTGRMTWHRDQPLTPERLAKHVNGGPYRGVCPIKEGESTTTLAVLDFDSHRGETSWHDMSRIVLDVAGTLDLLGGAPILFRSSGGHGVHLYLLWDTPQDAHSVREWLRGVLNCSGLRVGTDGVRGGCVEVFPKQSEVKPGGCGSQFILALAGASRPLVWDDLSGCLVDVPRETLVGTDWGAVSCDVPVVESSSRALVVRSEGEVLRAEGAWADALTALKNGADGSEPLDYDRWRNVVFAIHHETGGSDEGLALAHEFSARAAGKYDPDFLTERVWPYVSVGGGVTGGTIMSYAAQLHGWSEPLDEGAFDVVPSVSAGGVASGGTVAVTPVVPVTLDLPPFRRDRAGAVLPEVRNAVMALRRDDVCGFRIGHDIFRDEITVARPGTDEWRPMTDADLVRIRIRLEEVPFKSVDKGLARDAAVLVADEGRYDSAQLWLRGLPAWDGFKRVETFLIDRWGCRDTPYARAVGRYLWTAMAGRVLDPGCQADMAPILEGDQGLRKSSAIAAMVPAPEQFIEVDLAAREEDTARAMRGVLVGEIAELRGLHTKDEDAVKKFMTRRFEKWVPKYREFATTFARRIVFVATVNPKTIGFLADETGNRRWLPIHVHKCDVEGVVRDRDQLWAEAAHLWQASGVAWQDAEKLAEAEHPQYMMEDAWDDAVASWLKETDPFAGSEPRAVTVSEIACGALGFSLRDVGQLAQRRIGAILRKLGYEKRNLRREGSQQKTWVLSRTER